MNNAIRLSLTLVLGYAGAMLFNAMSAPLPWMLGPLFVGLGAVAMRIPLYIPKPLGRIMGIPLGLLVGSKMTVDILAGGVGRLLVPLAGLIVLLAVTSVIGYLIFRRLGHDRATAFFATVPGGIQEMTMLGDQFNADVRHIAIAHATRIIVVVGLLSFAAPFVASIVAPASSSSADLREMTVLPRMGLVPLLFVAAGGVLLGKLLRMRAPLLLGPLLVSAVLLLLTEQRAQPADLVVQMAQMVLGLSIACRFVGHSQRGMLNVVVFAALTTVLSLLLAGLLTVLVCAVAALDPRAVLLAFAPGGLAESSLIATAMHADVALVALGHLTRIFLVTLCAAVIFDKGVSRA